ncbi:helix-turn-helix transcriptional regulator [Amycolatopsis sp. FDAARGOS 1241]|uniref:helix-turn-helix domain-containing protein n=1 Tax=Amycolatopsis sp. FDAARGOS 1241 TaxID=2778070 RepID=UPI00351CB352
MNPPATRPGALTADETRIARLAADGHTNHEVAARLVLNPRTVEWHLSRATLDVTSRGRLRPRWQASGGDHAPPREVRHRRAAGEPGEAAGERRARQADFGGQVFEPPRARGIGVQRFECGRDFGVRQGFGPTGAGVFGEPRTHEVNEQ